jgi:hypothetical protein
MLSLHPELFARSASLSAELIPPLKKGLQNNTRVMLTGEQFKELRYFLLDIRSEASPRLKTAISYVLKKLNSEKFLKTVGVTVIR